MCIHLDKLLRLYVDNHTIILQHNLCYMSLHGVNNIHVHGLVSIAMLKISFTGPL